jgi:hypothetical protein
MWTDPDAFNANERLRQPQPGGCGAKRLNAVLPQWLALQFNSCLGGLVDDVQLRKLSGFRRSTAYTPLPTLKQEDALEN